MENYKIILIDDHKLFLEGLKLLLSQDERYSITEYFMINELIISKIIQLNPDLVITDINMPGINGIDLLILLKHQNPKIKVILLSVREDNFIIHKIKKENADGYLSKNEDAESFTIAVEKILQGEKYFKDPLSFQNTFKNNPSKVSLTQRERDVLFLLAQGKTIKEAANILYISQSTVVSHKKNLFQKTETNSLVELANFALTNGLI